MRDRVLQRLAGGGSDGSDHVSAPTADALYLGRDSAASVRRMLNAVGQVQQPLHVSTVPPPPQPPLQQQLQLPDGFDLTFMAQLGASAPPTLLGDTFPVGPLFNWDQNMDLMYTSPWP